MSWWRSNRSNTKVKRNDFKIMVKTFTKQIKIVTLDINNSVKIR